MRTCIPVEDSLDLETPFLSPNGASERLPPSAVLDETALFTYLGGVVPRRTFGQWRYRGLGPRFVKLGRHVAYRKVDVDEWLAGKASRASPSPK